jgi:opacity protein-like surface antigen
MKPRHGYSSSVAPSAVRRLLAWTPLVVFVGAFIGAGPGRAVADEDDWQIAARTGIASVVVDGRSPLGVGLGSDIQYGINDTFSARLSLSGGLQRVSAETNKQLPGGSIWSYATFAGLGYTMDVLRLLPTFEAGIGVLGVAGAVKKNHTALGMQLGIGADYLLTPRFSVGATAQYVFAPFDLLSHVLTGDQVPQAFAFSARVTWTIR